MDKLSFSRRKASVGFVAAAILCVANVPAQSAPRIVEFEISTAPFFDIAGINASGFITGSYQNQPVSPNGSNGFIRAPDGTLTTFNLAGSMATSPTAINAAGVVTGFYATGYPAVGGGPYSGFVRNVDGTIATFSGPNSTNTGPTSINSAGMIAGYYLVATTNHNANYCGFIYGYVPHGFVRSPGGNLVSFDPPGAISTVPMGINDNGLVTGYYCDSKNIPHGFLRNSGGRYVLVDPPGSIEDGVGGSNLIAINFAGAAIGTYNVGKTNTGFVRHSDGVIQTFAPTGAVQTNLGAIDDAGAVTGSYVDSSGATHGFERYSNGTIITFDAPGAIFNSSGGGTTPVGINASGQIVGTYTTSLSTGRGFLRIP